MKNEQEIQEWLKTRNIQQIVDNYSKKFKDKKIIIYGAGLLSDLIFKNYDMSNLNIIAVADSNSNNADFFHNIKKCTPDKIIKFKPDVIISCTYNQKMIRKFLKDTYPEVAKIKFCSIIKKTLNDKIKFFIECFS